MGVDYSEWVGAYAHRPQPVAVTPVKPYPTGRISWGYLSRHFVPGYDRSVPTGRGFRPEKCPNSARRAGARAYLAKCELFSGENSRGASPGHYAIVS